MSISFGSINTGLPKDIVQQIIKAEKIPVEKMNARKEKIQAKQKLVTELTQLVEKARDNVRANGNSRSLRELKVITNEEIVEVNADKNIASPGSYQFEVVELAQKSSAMTSGFEDPDESYVGVGFIQYFLPNGETKDIYIDEDNASLNGVAKLINKDLDNGMKAYVVNDGTGTENPWRLIISLEDTGDTNQAQFPYFYFVDGIDDFYVEFERKAHDAKIKLDGFEIELEGNDASNLLPGVNIDLKKAMPGEEFTIQIVEDVQKITEKVGALVESINDVLKFIKVQNKMDETTDTSRTLGGDIILTTIESKLRGVIFSGVKTEFGIKRFGDLGIEFQRDGLLKLNTNKLESNISKSYDMVSQILTGMRDDDGVYHDGFINKLGNTLKGILVQPYGTLASRSKGISSKIEQIDRQIANRERIIENKEKYLKDKFARLEGMISRIKSQGAGLSALGGQSVNPVTNLAG